MPKCIKITVILISIILLSCSLITKPNNPYPGPYPTGFKELSQRNPLLAKELGKLPELQDGLSTDEATAIERLINIYNDNNEAFDKAFGRMYLIGKPEVRKYCSPLQAFFWLLEDGNSAAAEFIVNKFEIEKLLNYSWNFDSGSETLKDALAEKLINCITDNGLLNDIHEYQISDFDGTSSDYIITMANEHPEAFDCKVPTQISYNKIKSEENWNDFDTVIERLNAPILVNYYVRKNFTYTKGPIDGSWEYAGPTFSRKKGHCIAWANFGVYPLKRAGYKTFMRSVNWSGPPCCSDHTVGGVIENGKYVVVSDSGNPAISIFNNIDALDAYVAGGNEITGRMWGHKRGVNWD